MANYSRFAYTRLFESSDALLPHCWLVVRIDGKGFTKFSEAHGFAKPNDLRALRLMNVAAQAVMEEFSDIVLAYGHSDEFSFVLRPTCSLYERRASKLTSVFASLFASNYVMRWSEQMGSETALRSAPAFDARCVAYPTAAVLRDYLSWRQADCHVNNQYNACFWALVGAGESREAAQAALKGTLADAKNELLFSRFGINYATLPAIERRGSVLHRTRELVEVKPGVLRPRLRVATEHEDVIGEAFWAARPELLGAAAS